MSTYPTNTSPVLKTINFCKSQAYLTEHSETNPFFDSILDFFKYVGGKLYVADDDYGFRYSDTLDANGVPVIYRSDVESYPGEIIGDWVLDDILSCLKKITATSLFFQYGGNPVWVDGCGYVAYDGHLFYKEGDATKLAPLSGAEIDVISWQKAVTHSASGAGMWFSGFWTYPREPLVPFYTDPYAVDDTFHVTDGDGVVHWYWEDPYGFFEWYSALHPGAVYWEDGTGTYDTITTGTDYPLPRPFNITGNEVSSFVCKAVRSGSYAEPPADLSPAVSFVRAYWTQDGSAFVFDSTTESNANFTVLAPSSMTLGPNVYFVVDWNFTNL